MAKLRVFSGVELINIFLKIGYEVDHQTGSHIILRNHEYPNRRLTVPNKSHKELPRLFFLTLSHEICYKLIKFQNNKILKNNNRHYECWFSIQRKENK